MSVGVYLWIVQEATEEDPQNAKTRCRYRLILKGLTMKRQSMRVLKRHGRDVDELDGMKPALAVFSYRVGPLL